MAGLDALVIGGMDHHDPPPRPRIDRGRREKPRAFALGGLEMAQEHRGIGAVEVVARILLLGLAEDVAITQRNGRLRIVEGHVHDVIDAQHIHREAFEAIGDLARDGGAVVAADLLEIGELAHLHAVAPDLPAQAPGAERRALPVVLDKADVVAGGIEPDGREASQIERLHVGGGWFDDDLILVIMLEPVGVVAIAPVGRPARGLDIGRSPGARPERAQRRRGVEGARAHLHVVGLQDGAALRRPIGLKPQDHLLKAARRPRRARPAHRHAAAP